MIHQNVRNIILHISVALECDCCKPNVPINMKICRFFEKKCELDLLSFHAVTWIFKMFFQDLYWMIEHVIGITLVPHELG